MKYKKLLTLLISSTMLLGACNQGSQASNSGSNNYDDSSSSGDSSGSGSSSGSQETTDWSQAVKNMMNQYMGITLPYIKLGNSVQTDVWEYEDMTQGVVFATSQSDVFENYYEDLLAAGLEMMGSAADGYVMYDEYSDPYYTAYRLFDEDTIAFVDCQYLYDYEDIEDGNYLMMYQVDKATSLTTNTDWTDEEKETFASVIYQELPFMAFGEDYAVEEGETDEYYFIQISDSYTSDLTGAYGEILLDNGFSLSQGVYTLTTSENNTLCVEMEYDSILGNYVYAYIEINVMDSLTWPSDWVSAQLAGTGYSIPSFTASAYSYYVSGGQFTIMGLVDSDISASYAEAVKTQTGVTPEKDPLYSYLLGIDFYEGISWDETFNISFITMQDEDTGSYVFYLMVNPNVEPEYDELASLFPLADIKEFLGFASDFPAPADPSNQGYKVTYVEDEEDGNFVFVNIYDDGEVGVDSLMDVYYQTLMDALWYCDTYKADDITFESPDGKIALYFYTSYGVFNLYIYEGSGVEHQPSLTLNKATANIKPGASLTLVANKQMIADEIVWSSNNEKINVVDGVVTAASDAAINSTATITAKAGSYEATCVVTVKEESYYTKVTSELADWSGEYLIVYETDSKSYAFNGGLNSLDASKNYVEVTPNNGQIVQTKALEDATFTISKFEDGYSICNATGTYIDRASATKNGLDSSQTECALGVSYNSSKSCVDIEASGGGILQFNAASDQMRFRFYISANQQNIQLYKLD